MKQFDFSDLVVIVGLTLLTGGLVAFDWRVAAVIIGLVLLVLGLVGAVRR